MRKFASFMRKFFTALFIISVFVVVGTSLYKLYLESLPPKPTVNSVSKEEYKPPVIPDDPSLPSSNSLKTGLHDQKFAIGKFGPNKERLAYQSGDMVLYIPKMDIIEPVLSIPISEIMETEEYKRLSEKDKLAFLLSKMQEALDEGITLFNESAVPGTGNRNVSIAGHRDAKNKEFYYIDQLSDGDLIYIIYKNRQYVYEYEETIVTDEDDWEPIKSKDYNLITLQSCEPIAPLNGKYDRIFVTAKLKEIIFLDPEDFDEYTRLTLQGPPEPRALSKNNASSKTESAESSSQKSASTAESDNTSKAEETSKPETQADSQK